jgi:hypothetical protein
MNRSLFDISQDSFDLSAAPEPAHVGLPFPREVADRD